MRNKYEIIVRPPSIPAPRVLECDGPTGDTRVNYGIGTMLPVMSFEQWKDLPDHAKNPRYTNPSNQDADSAARIGRLLSAGCQSGSISRAHMLEIMSRFELLFPGTIEAVRQTKLSA